MHTSCRLSPAEQSSSTTGAFLPLSVLGYLVPEFISSRELETFEAHDAEDKHAPCTHSEWNEANATTAMRGPLSRSTFLPYTILQGKQSQLVGATYTMYCNHHTVTNALSPTRPRKATSVTDSVGFTIARKQVWWKKHNDIVKSPRK